METNRIMYVAISVIAIFLPNSSSLSSSQQPITNTSVLDVDGNPLQANTKYYITSPLHGGGGLALSIRDRRSSPCPPNVMQENDETSVGLSLKIFSSLENNNKQSSTSQGIIKVSTDVNIAFMAATTCVQRTVWKLGVADGITGQRYVRSGGVLGRAGAETVGNWFKIEKIISITSGKGYYYYKIVYCPSVCSSCKVVDCGEVGVFVEEGKKWLGLGGQPLVVAFKKVFSN